MDFELLWKIFCLQLLWYRPSAATKSLKLSNRIFNTSHCSSFFLRHSCRIFSFIGNVLTSHQSILFGLWGSTLHSFLQYSHVSSWLSSCRFALSRCANRFSRLFFQSVVRIFLTVTIDFDKMCITIFIKEWCKMAVSNSLTVVNEFRYTIIDSI